MSNRIVTVQEKTGLIHAWTPGTLLAHCGANVLGMQVVHQDEPTAAEMTCRACASSAGWTRTWRSHRSIPPSGDWTSPGPAGSSTGVAALL